MDPKILHFWKVTDDRVINVSALVISIISLLLTIYGFFNASLPFRDIFSLATVFFIFIATVVMRKNYLSNKKSKIEIPEIYSNINEDQQIHRKEIDRLKSFINYNNKAEDQKNKIAIITGRSGVGKSFISREILISYAESQGYNVNKNALHNRTFTIIDKYVSGDILKELGCIPKEKQEMNLNAIINKINEKTIIIFDQFEDLFKLPLKTSILNGNNSSREKSIEILKSFFDHVLISKDIKIFIILREEFVFNLFIFMKILPWCDFIPIYGLAEEKKNEIVLDNTKYPETTTEFIFDQLMSDDNLVLQLDENRNYKKNRTILPIEATIIFKMLNTQYPLLESVGIKDIEHFKGVRNIVIEYLKRFVETSSNPINCSRILYSLSVSPRENRQLTSAAISNITHIDIEEVKVLVNELHGKGLIKKISSETYLCDWSHDFLAERFHEVSASILTPEDRDNISFFWHQYRRGVDFSEFIRKDKTDKDKSGFYSNFFLIISLILLILRTFRFPFDPWSKWPEPFTGNLGWEFVTNIDIPFLFIAISLTIWAFYTNFIYKYILSVIIETGAITKSVTVILPVFSTACVLGTCIFPTYWISFTGLGGLIVGIKFLHLGRIEGKKVWKIFQRRAGWFFSAGIQTIFNCLVLIAVGIFYSEFFKPDSLLSNPSTFWVSLFSFVVWIVMVVFAYFISIKSHAIKSVVPTRIGEYVRNQYRVQINL